MTEQFPDLVPARLRREWAAQGRYPDRSLFALFRERAAAHPDRPAVIDDEGVTTYAQLYAAATGFATALRDAGVRPGDIVAAQLPNTWRSCAVDLGVIARGAVVLPYPPGRGRLESLALLRRSRAAAVVVPAGTAGFDFAGAIDGLRPDLPGLHTVCTTEGERPGCVPADPALDRSGADPAGPLPEAVTVDVDPDGPARILVSSGSEAEPKLVLYSHNALAGGRGAFMAGISGGVAPVRNLFLPPLGTAYGSLGSFVTLACHGGTLILTRRFHAAGALDLIARHRPTHVFAVPAMLQMMLAAGPAADAPTGLVAIVCGGSSVDGATIDGCIERFGARFVNLYGSADGVNCYTRLDDPVAVAHTSVGRPDPAVAAFRVVDEAGADVPEGEIGELICRGPLSPMCYVNAPELDRRYRTADGWVRTGDLGYRDPDGYLRVVRRLKDVIIRGGRNISPAEVEAVLARHPGVRSVACVGVPDARLGERIGAAIVPTAPDRAPTLRDLLDFLRGEGLEQGKWPEELRLFEALPLSPAGKVDKRVVAASFGEPRPATVPAPRPLGSAEPFSGAAAGR